MLTKNRTRRWFEIRVVVSGCCGSALIAFGQVAPAQPDLPNFDSRGNGAGLSPAQQDGLAQLRTRTPAIRVDADLVLGSPAWLMSAEGFLSGPPELEIARQGSLGLSPDDPYRPIKAFIIENTALFGHGLEVLTNATMKDDFVTPHNGLRTVVWEQQLDGIPVFEGLLIGHITRRGELVNLSSHFVPSVEAASQMDSTRRAMLETKPPV